LTQRIRTDLNVGEWDGSGSEAMAVGVRRWQWERGDGSGSEAMAVGARRWQWETAKRRQRSGPLERSTNAKGHKRRIRKDRWVPRPVNRVNT
jgi:hypothetical protein